jgi:hypothetical protein
MKKILLLLIFINGLAQAQIVNIPDANFKAKLLQADISNQIAYNNTMGYIKIDSNNDGEIQESEALLINGLYINSSNISDLTGIESFTNLLQLSCGNNQLTEINIHNLQSLLTINCINNPQLTSVDVSGLSSLTQFMYIVPSLISLNVSNCSSLTQLYYNGYSNPGNLTSLNISGCISMTTLTLEYFPLTTINASGLINLTQLYVDHNQLTSLNVDGCSSLVVLECQFNQLTQLNLNNLQSLGSVRTNDNLLTSLNFSNLPVLQGLDCFNNPLSVIDISSFPSLSNLWVGKVGFPLQFLNTKNGILTTLSFAAPVIINYACIDEVEFNNYSSMSQIQNLNSYCSFVPGGNYNTISGNIRYDFNNNGCDASDYIHKNIRVNINDGTTQGTTFTNNSGNYSFLTQAGNFILTPSIENPSWFTFSPTTANIIFADNNNNLRTQDFCITSNGIHPDLEVLVAPIFQAQPGFDSYYSIVYKNKGNQSLSGNVSFTFNDAVLDFVYSNINPDAQTTGNLSWDYSNLLPFESRSITVTLNVNSPTETPAVNIGDVLNFSAMISPIAGDENPTDNSFTINQTVVGSYDPNDKICLEGNIVASTKIGDYLHYNINFENTGTASATFVVVKDIIDTAKFDINSLQVMNTSHPATTRITGNKVEFIFENINLGANQHGNVTFKIKTKSTLVTGNTVTNNANIYFDYNFPITTNTASTTFQTLSNSVYNLDKSISVYPNPTASIINIKSDYTIKSVELYDVQGRVLQSKLENENASILDISNQTTGIYFVKITSEKGSKVEKIVKE